MLSATALPLLVFSLVPSMFAAVLAMTWGVILPLIIAGAITAAIFVFVASSIMAQFAGAALLSLSTSPMLTSRRVICWKVLIWSGIILLGVAIAMTIQAATNFWWDDLWLGLTLATYSIPLSLLGSLLLGAEIARANHHVSAATWAIVIAVLVGIALGLAIGANGFGVQTPPSIAAILFTSSSAPFVGVGIFLTMKEVRMCVPATRAAARSISCPDNG